MGDRKGPQAGRGGLARRKTGAAPELLWREDLESAARDYSVTAATPQVRRNAFLAVGLTGVIIPVEDLADENGLRMESAVAELAITLGLQRERIESLDVRHALFA